MHPPATDAPAKAKAAGTNANVRNGCAAVRAGMVASAQMRAGRVVPAPAFCQAIVTPMVNKSADPDLRATKTPFEVMKEVEQKAGATAPPAPAKLTPADKEDVE